MRSTALLLSLALAVPFTAFGDSSEELMDAKCEYECQTYTRSSDRASSPRAQHEADACTCACYHRSSPVGDPDRALFKECALENTRAARSLGSSIPDPKLD